MGSGAFADGQDAWSIVLFPSLSSYNGMAMTSAFFNMAQGFSDVTTATTRQEDILRHMLPIVKGMRYIHF